jgi:hypothetical protein
MLGTATQVLSGIKAFTPQELSEFNTIYSPYLPPQP